VQAYRGLELHGALIEEAVAACPEPLACDQVEYHPYLDQTKVLEACARQGMAVVAYSPVAKGRIKNDQTLARIGQNTARAPPRFVCAGWSSRTFRRYRGPRGSNGCRKISNIFDFTLSEERMRLISAMGSAKGRLTDFGFAPKWD